jgi:hypothetical protein
MNELQIELARIQKELKAPKGQTNSFGGYKYRSCEDILEAVKPLLRNLTLTLSDEVVNVGTKNYVKATAHLADDKGLIQVSAYAREAEDKKGMDDAQITGAASSYARKYALNGLFAIDDTKDADTMDNTVKNTTPKAIESPVDKENYKETVTGSAQDLHFCSIHSETMRERKSYNGGTYYDHRQQIDGVWNTCTGTGFKEQAPKKILERDINDFS